MKPRITVLTIGEDDLKRVAEVLSGRAWAGNGWDCRGRIRVRRSRFFDLQNGLKLALYPRESIAHDANIAQATESPTEFTIGHNVNSKKEVDAVMAQAEKAGAKIIKPAQSTFWGGYAGYCQDPDGHLWEIVWNPAWEIKD